MLYDQLYFTLDNLIFSKLFCEALKAAKSELGVGP